MIEEIIDKIYQYKEDELTFDLIHNIKREFASSHKLKDVPSNIKLLSVYREMVDKGVYERKTYIENILRRKAIRSQSGIVAVQVLTKPFACPGQCIFCPNDESMPKSYIKSEPGAMRAALNGFDPIKQVYNRLSSLQVTGHKTDKIELIILGGTWDYYEEEYKDYFIKSVYDAVNTFADLEIKKREDVDTADFRENKFSYDIVNLDQIKYSENIEEAIEKNELAENRIIGLTIETRPEFVTDENCRKWRRYGVTRLEIGVQTVFDDILAMNRRGHTMDDVYKAIHKLRMYGFKFCVHIMPGLYGSDYEKDIQTFVEMYQDDYLKPDEIKFYPTSVIQNTELFRLYQDGKYVPLETDDIKKMIKQTFGEIIPPYTRIKRLIRDIPATEIVAGSNVTNLAQVVQRELQEELEKNLESEGRKFYQRIYGDCVFYPGEFDVEKISEQKMEDNSSEIVSYVFGYQPDIVSWRKFVCLDTRSREIHNKWKLKSGQSKIDDKNDKINIVVRLYKSSVGQEFFVSCEDDLGYLYGFVRLLLASDGNYVEWEGLGENTALIRELHVYGQIAGLNKDEKTNMEQKQHQGLGRKLMDIAEQLAKARGFGRISVISGVGVREYYKKLGYGKEGTYMVKTLKR